MPDRHTRAARGSGHPESVTRSSVTPIFQTTAFDIDDLHQLQRIVDGEDPAYVYTRDGNPNHDVFAQDVAALEGAEDGAVFASGMGGLAGVLLSELAAGDHLLIARGLYGRTVQLAERLSARMGIDVTWVDAANAAGFAEFITKRTRLCVVETVSNPLLEVSDLPAIVKALGDVPLLVDSTFTTPCLIRPLEFGARYVFHSASKYLNGHGDVSLGVVVGTRDDMTRLREVISLFGMNGNPFETWLGSRGLRTLPLRMERVSRTAQCLAERLQEHPRITTVYYPGLETHATAAVAQRLLPHGCGGMLSVELAGGEQAVQSLFARLDQIPFSPTLADARTTVSYPAGTSHRFVSAADRERLGITAGLVRISVGLEAVEDLWGELSTGLG